MTATQHDNLVESNVEGLRELDDIINKAIRKVKGSKENDLCKFLPVDRGGYMHHFTLRKMKSEKPRELGGMISKFIINTDKPAKVAPKHRAARGSRKKQDMILLTKIELERVLGHIRSAGDQDLVVKLSPRKSLAQAKKQLIASIRQNKIDQEQWSIYVDAVHNSMNPSHSTAPSAQIVGVTTIHTANK